MLRVDERTLVLMSEAAARVMRGRELAMEMVRRMEESRLLFTACVRELETVAEMREKLSEQARRQAPRPEPSPEHA